MSGKAINSTYKIFLTYNFLAHLCGGGKKDCSTVKVTLGQHRLGGCLIFNKVQGVRDVNYTSKKLLKYK